MSERKIPYSSSDWEAEGVTCSVHQGYRIGQEVAARLMRMIRNRDCDDKGYTHVVVDRQFWGDGLFYVGDEVPKEIQPRQSGLADCDDKGYTHVLPPEIYLGRTVGPARDAR